MKTLYLHIGTQKTATTSIQRFCIDNAEALDAQGAAYPLMPFHYDNIGLARNGNFLLGRGTPSLASRKKTEDAERVSDLDAETRRRLERAAREHAASMAESPDAGAASFENVALGPRGADWPKWLGIGLDVVAAAFEDHDTVILSDEVIWSSVVNCRDSFWEPLLAHADEHAYDVRVIVYLRRQDAYLASDYNQHVKAGDLPYGRMRWKRYLRRATAYRLDYHAPLERIASHIGRDHIIVRIYDRGILEEHGGIFADFLDAVSLALDETFAYPDHDFNAVSLTPDLLAVKRAVNASEHFTWACRRPSREAAELCLANLQQRRKRKRLFSTRRAEELLAECAETNDAIARDYLHTDAPLFDMTVEDARPWRFGSPRMADVAIAYYCTWNSIQNCMLDPRLGEPEAPLVTDGARELWTGPRPDRTVSRAALDALADFFCRRQSDIASGAARELYAQESVIAFARALFSGTPLDEALPLVRATATPIPLRTRLKNLVSGITP